MKIALINENSQADKNKMIYECLDEVSKKYGHTVYNYGMYDKEDNELTYVQVGLLSAILLNSKAVDFVITGCGTGEGAMLACNSFPNVLCGHITDSLDAYLFGQINNGNAIAIPFAKDFGWGSELKLKDIFDNLFKEEFGKGYPKERVIPEQRNKKILDEVKKITHTNMIDILKNIDQDFLRQTISGKNFKEYFIENAKDDDIKKYISTIIN